MDKCRKCDKEISDNEKEWNTSEICRACHSEERIGILEKDLKKLERKVDIYIG